MINLKKVQIAYVKIKLAEMLEKYSL